MVSRAPRRRVLRRSRSCLRARGGHLVALDAHHDRESPYAIAELRIVAPSTLAVVREDCDHVKRWIVLFAIPTAGRADPRALRIAQEMGTERYVVPIALRGTVLHVFADDSLRQPP